ncbi:fimbria/pilus chaperone family protein [Pseudomonas abieticivorans]|uniref:fimbria/pilus chaperone family protein n=1 Tax=Pseudomonas abieticivorans TaxID=2931382 RepID=UPI0020C01F1B|nr:fimbria/pilus chaperone family protein [Pseudomonas sp. PIA16]
MNLPNPSRWWVAPALALSFCTKVIAAGMVPDTTVLRVNVADGEATINVTNTDNTPSLLYTSLTSLDQGPQPFLLASPPIARVEPGEKQLVRFMLKPGQSITRQTMGRVIFEGFPQRQTSEDTEIAVTVRQNLPVIIHPKGLPENTQPWKELSWSLEPSGLVVRNDSPYVVRLSQQLNLLPDNLSLQLPHSYILPDTQLQLELPTPLQDATQRTVRLYPASQYGFQGQPYDVQLPCTPATNGCEP